VKNYTIRRYTAPDSDNWNAFINKAKNATFLFHRDYMDYHADRFEDHSLIILDNEKWVAVLPANITGGSVFSHQGLTYGGLIYDHKMKLSVVVNVVRDVVKFLASNGVEKLHLKLMPSIYHDKPSEELNYVLFPADAKLVRRDSLSVLDMSKPYAPTPDRQKCIRRGEKNELEIKEEPNFKLFWNEILIPNMNSKHGVNPVHSVDEIEKLHRHFPDNIRHFNVYHKEAIVAGTTIYVTKNVIHPQYISGQGFKNELGSLDFLYNHLITNVFPDHRYFDFGISNEANGKKINEGLLFWKESFGTGTVVQDFYEVGTSNYKLLDKVLI